VIGTFINVAAILFGGSLGLLFGARFPERMNQTVVAGLGLFVALLGIQMSLKMQQPLVVLGALLLGGLIGEWLQIEEGMRQLGAWLEAHFTRHPKSDVESTTSSDPALAIEPVSNPFSQEVGSSASGNHGSRFIRGFLTAALVYTIGPIAILGAIQDGLTGDYRLLAVKAVLDGFASLAFASSLGVGVLFSSLVILVYQGGLTLLAAQAQAVITTPMMDEMTATGGILLVGIAISSLLEIKPIRIGNFLPSLVIAPLIMAILAALGYVK
jgi:uncharacterized membrane protein YqgA involved in biofilm formation